MRLLEVILADLPRLCREARNLGKINIQDGTKGGLAGASALRWISVDQHDRDALGFTERVSPAGSRNLIAPDKSYMSVLQQVVRPARDVLHTHDLKGFHELRAAYACERYEQVTQHRAPINGGRCYEIDRCLDREARKQISYELGHGRIDVSLRTLEDVHEQAIRYGAVLGCGADRVVRNAAASFAAGENHPDRNRSTLAARYTLGLAEKACGLVS